MKLGLVFGTFSQLLGELLANDSARVALRVHGMAHAVHEPGMVERLALDHARKVVDHLVVVFPVFNLLLGLCVHGANLVVRTTMAAALQRPDGGCVRGIRVSVGGAEHARGKRRVVTAAVLSVQAQHDVEHARLVGRELAVGAQHRQNGLGGRLTGDELVHDHGAVGESRVFRIIGKHHDARQAADEAHRRVNLVFGRAVLVVRVVRVQLQHRAREHVHKVGRHIEHVDGRDEAIGKLALGVDDADEALELALRGKLAKQQQVGDLLEVEPALGTALHQIAQLVATVKQRALIGYLHAIAHHIAVHIRDVRGTGDDA